MNLQFLKHFLIQHEKNNFLKIDKYNSNFLKVQYKVGTLVLIKKYFFFCEILCHNFVIINYYIGFTR